jgi:hypothetical protein
MSGALRNIRGVPLLPVPASDFLNIPLGVHQGCSTSDVEDIRTDIKTNLEFDKLNQDFWQCMMLICDDEFQNQKMGDASRLQGDGLHSSIDADIERVLRGKSANELNGMESSIESKINRSAARI